MSHKQLAQEQRYQIYTLKKAGVKNTEIANILQVHKSTICRELKRNTGGRGYRPRQAHREDYYSHLAELYSAPTKVQRVASTASDRLSSLPSSTSIDISFA